MGAHTESAIRKSFLNCSKGAAQRISLPQEILQGDWESRVFLGWTDPKAPRTGYVVAETDDGLRGLVVERGAQTEKGGARMCQVCLTLHTATGVSMMSIQCSRTAKDRYRSIATHLCADLACSDRTRGLKLPAGIRQMEESLTAPEREARTLVNIQGLIQRVAETMGR